MLNQSFAETIAQRGVLPAYRSNEMNRCPGCQRTHWHIGRLTAECAFCSTALPLIEATRRDAPTILHGRSRLTAVAA